MEYSKNISPSEANDAAVFARAMREAANLTDREVRHIRMDDLMCEKLVELGYHEAVEVFQSTEMWCA